jgi:hypothetical protein
MAMVAQVIATLMFLQMNNGGGSSSCCHHRCYYKRMKNIIGEER